MIIACPECAGPFELRDDDIAALVQLACPHCRFTMILDFAAANDASLVEAGMRMASGYRSAADYRRAALPQVHVAEVEQAPAHVELPVERTPEVARPVSPPTAVPVAPPASTQPPIAATLPAVSDASDVVSMLFVCPAAAMSWPFLSTRNTTFAFASLVKRSHTALIRWNSSSYITSCEAMRSKLS